MWYFVFMSFVRPTHQEYLVLNHEWKKEALRATIGQMTLGLISIGEVDVLQSEGFKPISNAWEEALKTTAPQLTDLAPESE
jgi:hypothetical protein